LPARAKKKDLLFMDPKTLRFTPTHEWVHIQGNEATIGISRFAVDQLTDLIMIELPKPGTRVAAGKSFGEIESVKAVSDLYAPLSGEVIAANNDVAANVQLLAEDPYDRGWLIKIKLHQPADTSGLMDFDAYEARIADEEH
jgi:glycine cleavage system H protein